MAAINVTNFTACVSGTITVNASGAIAHYVLPKYPPGYPIANRSIRVYNYGNQKVYLEFHEHSPTAETNIGGMMPVGPDKIEIFGLRRGLEHFRIYTSTGASIVHLTIGSGI